MEVQSSSPTTSSRKKIFITNITSKLGWHLVQTLRNDHQQLQNYSLIIGSRQSKQCNERSQFNHPSIRATVNFEKNTNLFSKCILESNVIVMDIRQASDEVQFIVKLLQQKYKNRQSNNKVDNKQQLYIIGIGSHMTWSYQKPTAPKFQSSQTQKQHHLQKYLKHNPTLQQKILPEHYNKRIPHHLWTTERQIQKSILSLNRYSGVKSCLLTTGLLYGKDFPCVEIQDFVARCFACCEEVTVYGDGSNLLPLTYIDDFCDALGIVLNCMSKNQVMENLCFVSVDEKLCTQLQIVQYLLKCSGFVKQIKKHPLMFITRQEAIYSQSVPLKKSPEFTTNHSQTTFLNYFQENHSETCQYLSLEPTHYLIYGQQLQPQLLQQLDQNLSTVIQVFRQSDIVSQLCKKKNITKEEVDVHEINGLIQEIVLVGHDWESYVFVLCSNLLDTQVVKKYKLKKFQLFQDAPALLKHKYPQYQNMRSQQTETQQPHHQQQYPSHLKTPTQQPHQTHLTTPIQLNHSNNATASPSISQAYQQQQQLQIKKQLLRQELKQKQYKKYDQYLFDNVVKFIAEAYVNCKEDPRLPVFIEKLKEIYRREERVKVGSRGQTVC